MSSSLVLLLTHMTRHSVFMHYHKAVFGSYTLHMYPAQMGPLRIACKSKHNCLSRIFPPLPHPHSLYFWFELTFWSSLFERGSIAVGLDFLAHPFWDKYIEFEDRVEAQDKIFAILKRVIHIPMHQYARYFERFRQMAHTRPLTELVSEEQLAQFHNEIETENAALLPNVKNPGEIERDLRTKIDNFHLSIFTKN